MTGMLASVDCLDEALLIEALDVDIIDLKQPARGALGALDVADVAAIVAALRPGTVVSATIGDLPMQPDLVGAAVAGMAATGVDYVKIGLFPGGDWSGSIAAAGRFADKQSLIAVLFADTRPDFSVVPLLARAGFRGVMLDTMDKSAGSLTDWQSLERLERFLSLAREHALLTGLAGSLRLADVPGLLPLAADYLGFRGALCRQHNRVAALDPARIDAIRALFSEVEVGGCVDCGPA
ncbi:hypothetical protein BJL95_00700 [Methylomonas sp. LWB]|uniref:(5-formylfuran-3-yl)methyl phosphate synthase n=1 Tax=Methylomonas sp. LWB TaxID=1905845 RepID=UPI0008DA81EE|nr:(5-formylfuran-3-yl)methyl phosphate synthase [Methylomonas sp. LWB]OHX35103.1 hypothetical protein BJL95_00700 [Methylomonas sp. LWB]